MPDENAGRGSGKGGRGRGGRKEMGTTEGMRRRDVVGGRGVEVGEGWSCGGEGGEGKGTGGKDGGDEGGVGIHFWEGVSEEVGGEWDRWEGARKRSEIERND